MAAAGETPIGIALAYEVDVARKQGAPIDVIFPADGVAWTFEGNALVKGAKNPQNGRRFLDWAMSRSAMDAYVKWRGSGITRPHVPVSGAENTEMKLIPLDFVWAAEQKDPLGREWVGEVSRRGPPEKSPPPPPPTPSPGPPRGPGGAPP